MADIIAVDAILMMMMMMIAWLLLTISCCQSTPLDDYINKPDSSYKYIEVGNPDNQDGYTLHYINMTSQTWLSGRW